MVLMSFFIKIIGIGGSFLNSQTRESGLCQSVITLQHIIDKSSKCHKYLEPRSCKIFLAGVNLLL